jgi:structural maintenance of chromosome 1
LNNILQPYEHLKAELAKEEATIKQLEQKIAQVEDNIFEDFCMEINVSNIREYEAMQYGVSDEVTERRAQFAAQKSRLDTQLAFEKDQLNELVERLKKLEDSLASDTSAKHKLEADLSGMSGKTESLKRKLQSFQVDLEKQTQLEEAKQLEINEISSALEAKGKNVEDILREFKTVEGEMNKLRAERVTIFRRCKLEGIELPLTRGSMDDIIIEDSRSNLPSNDTDASSASDAASVSDASSVADSYNGSSDMDLDGPVSQLSIQSTDWEVEVDFSKVGPIQREDNSPAMDRKFQDEIKQYADAIEQMAPNLKAIDRLESVTERLVEAEKKFNEARSAAKSAKEAFNDIKKKR